MVTFYIILTNFVLADEHDGWYQSKEPLPNKEKVSFGNKQLLASLEKLYKTLQLLLQEEKIIKPKNCASLKLILNEEK
jgi:hypothetical protein